MSKVYKILQIFTTINQTTFLSNLLKFLLDINPATPMSASDRAALPTVGVDTTSTPGRTYLTLQYRQSPAASGVSVGVQTSTDLQTWQTVTSAVPQPTGVDAGTGDPIMEVKVDVTDQPVSFIRLQVTNQSSTFGLPTPN